MIWLDISSLQAIITKSLTLLPLRRTLFFVTMEPAFENWSSALVDDAGGSNICSAKPERAGKSD